MTKHPYRRELEQAKDPKHAAFSATLSPEQKPGTVLGIKQPVLKQFAKELYGTPECAVFLRDLPHKYHEENMMHSCILNRIRDFDECRKEVEVFLPYMNDWAVTDTLRPKVFAKHTAELEPHLKAWLNSEEPYTVRTAVGFYMAYYLGEAFAEEQMADIAALRFDHYYVRMMVAWYMATALVKQRDAAMKILKEEKLDVWTHNKTIQKAAESFRVSEADKALLRTMKRREV